jgi:hypothetical protein
VFGLWRKRKSVFDPLPGTGPDDWILYDVGGSRASVSHIPPLDFVLSDGSDVVLRQRNTWCSYFDNINSIIFLAPVSCFDQRLAEDASVNRLEDSLLIWKHICNSKLLLNIQLILYVTRRIQ